MMRIDILEKSIDTCRYYMKVKISLFVSIGMISFMDSFSRISTLIVSIFCITILLLRDIFETHTHKEEEVSRRFTAKKNKIGTENCKNNTAFQTL